MEETENLVCHILGGLCFEYNTEEKGTGADHEIHVVQLGEVHAAYDLNVLFAVQPEADF